jgi:hypothetical protein
VFAPEIATARGQAENDKKRRLASGLELSLALEGHNKSKGGVFVQEHGERSGRQRHSSINSETKVGLNHQGWFVSTSSDSQVGFRNGIVPRFPAPN